MKKALLISIIVGFFTIGCSIIETTVVDPIKGTGVITIKFVQVNDVYEIAPLNAGEYGGLARVAYIRDSIKEKFPNTYLFMAGDFLNPSLLGTLKVDGERLNGKQMVEVMNAMGFDLVTFGNHEFDLNEADLQKRLNESSFNWTSANVRHVTEKGIRPFATKWEYSNVPVSDYSTFKAYDTDGNMVRFGVFGVTLPSNPKDYVHYGDIYENAERAYKNAMDRSDFVVGLTHVSLEEDIEIAKRLPELPLIMGGHEHNNILERQGKTLIAKADANAKTAYIHTIIFNLRTKALHVNSELFPIDRRTRSESKVERIVNKWTALLDEKLKEIVDQPDEIIYSPSTPLDGTDTSSRGIQTNLGQLITRAMAYSYQNQVDASITNGGSIRVDDMLDGPLSAKDVFRVLPFGGTVLKVDLKGELLKKVVDYGESKKGTGAYLQRDNISRDGTGWLIGGKPIVDNKTYTVAFTDFLMKGLDIPFLTPQNKDIIRIYTPQENEVASDVRNAIISYLRSMKK
ncbi:MAG TPA: bifunctional metallophosphatase/5'-nucleotidase [Aequorivita sp.]|nr:bifunctional metallophosphatase/5'-nucleotidase [Aequorivita sp.]